MAILYVDSSALLKRVVVEAGSDAVRDTLRNRVAAGDLVTSATLARVEVWRVLRRGAVTDVDRLAKVAMPGIAEFSFDDAVLRSSRRIGPDLLRTPDAIHLASAVAVGASEI